VQLRHDGPGVVWSEPSHIEPILPLQGNLSFVLCNISCAPKQEQIANLT